MNSPLPAAMFLACLILIGPALGQSGEAMESDFSRSAAFIAQADSGAGATFGSVQNDIGRLWRNGAYSWLSQRFSRWGWR